MTNVTAPKASLDHTQLEHLLALTEHPEARAALVEQQVALHASKQLGDALENSRASREEEQNRGELVILVRVLRNLCAGGEAACKQLLQQGVPRLAADLCRDLTLEPQGDKVLLKVSAQLLANIAVASRQGSSSVWAETFPAVVTALVRHCDGGVQLAACMLLANCCRELPACSAQLCSPAGARIITALVDAVSAPNEAASPLAASLALLLQQLTFVSGQLPALLSPAGMQIERGSKARYQTVVLHLLATDLHSFLVATHDRLQANVDPALDCLARVVTESASNAAVAGQPEASGLLESGLQLVRELAALDSDASSSAQGQDMLLTPCYEQLLLSVLAMLHALEPIQHPRRPTQQSHTHAETLEQNERYPRRAPYFGYRSDLVAIIANSVHGRPTLQHAVYIAGGVQLLLNQCQISEDSPLVREWALWAVRNLCEGNPQVQQAIKDLELQGAVASPELQNLGMHVQMDAQTGKLQVIRAHGHES